MTNIRIIMPAVLLAIAVSVGTAGAQMDATKQPPPNTSPTSATTANLQLQRQLAPPRRAVKIQKRKSCEREAATKRLHLVKRWRFMRQCMRG
jgi:hypothetical protein